MMSESSGLTPKEVSVLRSIRPGGVPRKDIATALHVSSPELSRLVKSLESKGLISVRKEGVSHKVAFSEMRHASRLRRVLDEYGHMRLEKVLSLASLRIITSVAASPGSTRSEIISSSGVSARTLQKTLGELRALGMLRVDGRGIYSISDRFSPFADFAREFRSYANQKAALEFSSDSVIVWERGGEFLVRTKRGREDAGFRETAFSAFEDYGVPLLQDWHYHYHPCGDWRRTADEVLLQSLLISPLSTREMIVILVFWEKNELGKDVDRLREKARRYGRVSELESIVAYFEDPVKNRGPGFPKLSEVRTRMRG
jgi:DNA-binding MarR family transcriptional regulator